MLVGRWQNDLNCMLHIHFPPHLTYATLLNTDVSVSSVFVCLIFIILNYYYYYYYYYYLFLAVAMLHNKDPE